MCVGIQQEGCGTQAKFRKPAQVTLIVIHNQIVQINLHPISITIQINLITILIIVKLNLITRCLSVFDTVFLTCILLQYSLPRYCFSSSSSSSIPCFLCQGIAGSVFLVKVLLEQYFFAKVLFNLYSLSRYCRVAFLTPQISTEIA